ncbi:MAG: hypothetical protein U0264_02570 [Candidatus Kapaibacterium sp.]
MGKRKQIVPGSVFVRNGSKLLYIKYQGKHISTGLDDTPQGRKIAQDASSEYRLGIKQDSTSLQVNTNN